MGSVVHLSLSSSFHKFHRIPNPLDRIINKSKHCKGKKYLKRIISKTKKWKINLKQNQNKIHRKKLKKKLKNSNKEFQKKIKKKHSHLPK